MLIPIAYAAFLLLAILAFARLEARIAAVALYFGGWLLLPVAIYPHDTLTDPYFTVEVIGAGLPSNLGLTKAVVVPMAILIAWVALRVRRLEWQDLVLADAAMAGFCLWPLAGAFLRGGGGGQAVHDAAYLCGSWGASWLVGRGLFARPADWVLLLRGAAWSGVALLPIALTEGIAGPWLYRSVWGDHAFLMEGARRTFGYRPLGFFEHGNQYALWLALSAFAWLALWRIGVLRPVGRTFSLAIAAAVAASQSIGAIVLLAVATVAAIVPLAWLRRTALLGGAAVAMLGAVYLSGIVPAERIARVALGPDVVARFDVVRLRSLLYRIRRDQMAIPLLRKAPLVGTAQWAWWRPLGSHPWGLPLLLAGQFGAVAVLLLLIALLTAPIATLFRQEKSGILCALLVLVAATDAMFNSFAYFPAILFAGALTGTRSPDKMVVR